MRHCSVEEQSDSSTVAQKDRSNPEALAGIPKGIITPQDRFSGQLHAQMDDHCFRV